MKRFFYLIIPLIMTLACKEVFEDPPQSMLQATIFNSVTKKSMSSTVSVLGYGLDSLWIYQTELTSFLLPLMQRDTTVFLISFDSYIDTLTFFHETTQKYASMETGFYFDYKLDSIDFTNTRIDSVQITDSLITTKWNENIKLYIRPLPDSGN
jgi:hypothetical protein